MNIRLYFDTTELKGEGWPQVSDKHRLLAERATALGAVLVLPDPVEREAEARFFRDWTTSLEKASTDIRNLRKSLPAPGIYDPFPSKLSVEESRLRASYKEAVAWWKKELGVETCLLTAKTTTELFGNAVAHAPPFGPEGQGFQDTVIYHSALDDLARHPGAIALLLTRDKRFNMAGLRESERALGVHVEVMNLDAAIDWLETKQEDQQRRKTEEFEASLLAEIRSRPEEVEAFVQKNLELRPEDVHLYGDVKAIRELNVQSLERIRTGPPGRFAGTSFVLEAKLKLAFDYQIQTHIASQGVKLGEEAGMLTLQPLMPQIFRPGYAGSRTLEPQAEIQGRVTQDREGGNSIAFTGVKLRPWREWISLQDARALEGNDPFRPE